MFVCIDIYSDKLNDLYCCSNKSSYNLALLTMRMCMTTRDEVLLGSNINKETEPGRI